MKTSELIKKLTDVMSMDGDMDIEIRGCYGSSTETIENVYSSLEFYSPDKAFDTRKKVTIIETDLMSV